MSCHSCNAKRRTRWTRFYPGAERRGLCCRPIEGQIRKQFTLATTLRSTLDGNLGKTAPTDIGRCVGPNVRITGPCLTKRTGYCKEMVSAAWLNLDIFKDPSWVRNPIHRIRHPRCATPRVIVRCFVVSRIQQRRSAKRACVTRLGRQGVKWKRLQRPMREDVNVNVKQLP